jgi:cobalamin biosynthesis protein CbiG
MAKKILAVRLLVDEKQVQQSASFLDVSDEVISKEDLHRRFFDREPVVVDVTELGEEAMAMTLAFTGMILGKEEEENENV